MLLFLLCAAANDDYVALKAFYESMGGSGWAFNTNWDMSNTDVCTWGYDHSKVICTGGRVTALCASAYLLRCPQLRCLAAHARAALALAGNRAATG